VLKSRVSSGDCNRKTSKKNRGQREIKSKAASQQQQQIASFAKVLMLIYL